MLLYVFWFFVVPAGLAALVSVRAGRNYIEYVEAEVREEPPAYTPPVTVFVPVKGVDHDLAGNLLSLARQDYPDFELIVAAWSASDEALRVARTVLEDKVRVVVAGPPPEHTGEKVHNLLAAVGQARPESEVFVFADSDGQVESSWLRSLVAPLEDEELGAATGFRWYFPEEGGFWPLLRSVWDCTIAGAMRANEKNFAWGGATAIRRNTFEQARVPEHWRGTVSDDYRLTAALQEAKLGIRFVPRAMVATAGTCTATEFLRWATRQLVITKVYRRKMWATGFVTHVFYCGAMVASLLLAFTGNPLAWAGFIVTVLPGMGKGAMRGYAAQLMFPGREEWLGRYGWAYFWMVPLATWVWLYAFVASALTRRIEWRGRAYELLSPRQTRSACVQTASK